MRAIHIDDVHMLARFAALNDRMACYDVLVRAHVADKYRKKFIGRILNLGWARYRQRYFTRLNL